MLFNTRRSFLAITIVLLIVCSCRDFALAGSLIVDDWDHSGSLNFHGAWLGYSKQPVPTWDGTLHWGNLSGSTATLTFTGTSVQVFGAFKPVGTWSMQSQYAIDGGAPTTFLPPQEVHVEAYNQSFYESGSLPKGDHTLMITNLGAQLWLDYFLVNDEGSGRVTSSEDSRDRTSTMATTITATATVTSPAAKSTATSSSTNTPRQSTTSTTVTETPATTTSTPLIPSQNETSVSPTNSSSTSPTMTNTFPSSSPFSSLPFTLSLNGTLPPPAANAAQVPTTRTSHIVPIGLIVGVTLGGLSVLAILLALGCWYRRRQLGSPLSRGAALYPFSSSIPCDQNVLGHSDALTYDASFRESESQYSATLLIEPRLSRPVSSLTDLVESYAGGSDTGYRRSRDGGVRIAGGPGGDTGYAPSVSEAQSIKSRLPPVYQVYHAA